MAYLIAYPHKAKMQAAGLSQSIVSAPKLALCGIPKRHFLIFQLVSWLKPQGDYRVLTLKFLFVIAFLVLAKGALAQELSISITTTPKAVTGEIGTSLEASIAWHLDSETDTEESFEYEVSSNYPLIEVSPPSGRLTVGERLTTMLSHDCVEAHRRISTLTIRVGTLVRQVPWSITCAGAQIRFTTPREGRAVLDQSARTTLMWSFRMIGKPAETLSFQVTSNNQDLSLSPESGELGPNERSAIELSYSCRSVKTEDVTIQIKVGTAAAKVVWRVVCLQPSYRISVLEWPREVYEERVGRVVRGHLNWQTTSLERSANPVSYRISSQTIGLFYTPGGGEIQPEVSVQVDWRYVCRSRGERSLSMTIDVADTKREVRWQVKCLGEDLKSLDTLFFQGPLIAQMSSNYEEKQWQTTTKTETRYPDKSLWLDVNRITFVGVGYRHFNIRPLPITLKLVHDGEVEKELQHFDLSTEPIKDARIPQNYRTQFTFELTQPLFDQDHELHIEIDSNDAYPELQEDNNSIKLPLEELQTRSSQALKVTLVPLITAEGEPDLGEIEPYVNPIRDLMPVGQLEVTVREPLNISHLSWSRETASSVLAALHDLWLAEATRSDYYHGITPLPDSATSDNAVCGYATIGGNTAITMQLSSLCSRYSSAHEFGHNLSLYHAPACGAEANQVDHEYPYSDGSIGIETGWVTSQKQYISPEGALDFKYADIMSYCVESFSSQYSYGKAQSYRDGLIRSRLSRPNKALAKYRTDAYESQRSLVLSGTLDARGEWSLNAIQFSDQSPMVMSASEISSYELQLIDVSSGKTLHQERLGTYGIAHSNAGERFWGVRVPYFQDLELFLKILDRSGMVLLLQPLVQP